VFASDPIGAVEQCRLLAKFLPGGVRERLGLAVDYFGERAPPGPAIMPLGRHGRWLAANSLLADLTADTVFLLIQRFLLLFGDMASVLARHIAFLLANLMIFMVQLPRLSFVNLTFSVFSVDASALVLQTTINLGTSWVVVCPGAGHGARRNAERKSSRQDRGEHLSDCAVHVVTPFFPF
jgi:hypothetical protein